MNIQHLFPYSPGKYKKLTKGKEKQQPKKLKHSGKSIQKNIKKNKPSDSKISTREMRSATSLGKDVD